MMRKAKLVSVVLPVFKNAHHIPDLYSEIRQALKSSRTEILFVDDGSPDDSWQEIVSLSNKSTPSLKVRGIKLSRNFGQHNAIYAGLKASRGDFIVVMDADGQDNPVHIPEMLAAALKGNDIVHARRIYQRMTFNRFISAAVYRLLTWCSEITLHQTMGNFKLLSRLAVNAAVTFGGKRPLLELMATEVGFSQTAVDVVRRKRKKSSSSYNFSGALRFIGGFLSEYSSLVFHVFFWSGIVLVSGSALLLSGSPQNVTKSTLLLAAALLSGVILVVGAIIGFYIRTIQIAARRWPPFIIETEV